MSQAADSGDSMDGGKFSPGRLREKKCWGMSHLNGTTRVPQSPLAPVDAGGTTIPMESFLPLGSALPRAPRAHSAIVWG